MPGRKFIVTLSLAVLMIAVLACNATTSVAPAEPTASSQQPALPATEDQVPRVTPKEALAAYNSGTAILVDVRSQAAYQASRIAGAISVPMDEFESDIAGIALPKDQWIITYCT